jgi:hypothetical protein
MIRIVNDNGVPKYFNDDVEITEAEAIALHQATPQGVKAVNKRTLEEKFDAWIVANKAYIASPEGATVNARLNDLEQQVKRLSRENLALLRIVGDTLDDVSE